MVSDNRLGEFGQLPARKNDEGGDLRLNAEQRAALELLVSGKSVAETARSVGVSRSTVFRWLKNDATFLAAYNEWHEAIKKSARSRLLAMSDKAVDALEKALLADDAKLAFAMLKEMGLIGKFKPGSTDPEVLRREMEIDKLRTKTRLDMGEMMG